MLNFRLISEFQTIHRRPFEAAVPATLQPTNIRPLVDGEWLQLDGNYKADRGGDNSAGSQDAATVPSFCLFAEQGRYETQAIGKIPLLYLGKFEAETKIFDSAVGAGITAVGQKLVVSDLDIGGIVRRGLTALPASPAGTEFIQAYVTRLHGSNGGWLRFIVL